MARNILALNVGSSSIKFQVFRMEGLRSLEEPEDVLAHGEVEHIGAGSITASVETIVGSLSAIELDAVGHRIVHGGPRFFEPVLITDSVLDAVHALTELAPLHNPSGVAGVMTSRRLLPGLPNVAVFDTAFHHDLPAVAASYALPIGLSKELELRRYGFHGISYRYVSQRLGLRVNANSRRHIICHLGSGASVCAMIDGASVETSMGFTPLEGLIMGTRSGDVDPGLLLHLHRVRGMTMEEIDDLLNHRSGLLGLSATSADVRDLEASADEASKHALECFAYRISKYIGSYAAVLGGVDDLAFTGGIGQFSSRTRSRVCERLGFLGLSLNEASNSRASGKTVDRIGDRVWVVPTDEERQIARETLSVMA